MTLKNISLSGAVVAIWLNGILAGVHQGFELGHERVNPFTISGGSGYELLGRTYLFISVCFLIYFVGKIFKEGIIAQIVCVSVLILACFSFRTIYLQKRLFFNSTDAFTQLMRDTYPFDFLSFATTLTLLIFEIIVALKVISSVKKKD